MTAEERENYFKIARYLLDTRSGVEDAVEYVTKAVKLGPNLNLIERQTLTIAYKAVISPRRSGIKSLNAKINPLTVEEDENHSPELIKRLEELKQTLIDELVHYSKQLIDLIESIIKTENFPIEDSTFYVKLIADYYRYICEAYAEGTPEREEYLNLAEEKYKKALELSKNISEYLPLNLGLVLNYTVFLYDIVGNTQEAIRMGKEVYNRCAPLVDQNEETFQQEAISILSLIDENIKLWESIPNQSTE